MKKLLLRILFAIFFAFFLFFTFSAYHYYLAIHSDDPIVPYILIERWSATVVRGDIAIDMIWGDRYNLHEKDTIITGKESLAIVTWPDRSETRIGASSRMRIDRMQVARDYTSIEIEFALEEWKVWSTVVRTIYPGSYFRTRLPNQWVIAGVRGTVYDIDLTRWYIRSIDHNIALSDNRGNSVSLLPGEFVSVTDILQRLTRQVVDATWTTWNSARDTVSRQLYTSAIDMQLQKLTGNSTNIWDRFVRWVLSFIPLFDQIKHFELLLSDTASFGELHIPKQQILGIYQKLQDTKFVQEREKIRTYIYNNSGSVQLGWEYFDTFARGAVWDTISFTWLTLTWAEKLLDDYTSTLDTQIQSVIRVIPISELENKARETFREMIK